MGRVNMGRLEAFTIVPTLLYMADRRAEQDRTILLCYGEQCYLTVELDELFNDKFFDVSTATITAILPGMLQFVGTLYERLAFTGRGHQRFHHTRETYLFSSSFQFIQRFGIKIFSSLQSQLFSCKVTYGFTVHGKVHGACTGHYLNAFFLEIIQTFCTDSLNFRNNNIRLVFAYYTFQSISIEHAEYLTFICHLHGRRSGIRVASNDILALTLGRNNKLLAQLTGT